MTIDELMVKLAEDDVLNQEYLGAVKLGFKLTLDDIEKNAAVIARIKSMVKRTPKPKVISEVDAAANATIEAAGKSGVTGLPGRVRRWDPGQGKYVTR